MTAWTDVIGWTLVHFVWEGTLIALVAAGILHLLRRASASVRYAVACSALVVAIARAPACSITRALKASQALGRIRMAPS